MNQLTTFGREHVLANTSPMPANRKFIDRTGRKYKTDMGPATARFYMGYHEGFPAWWCEVDEKPGDFVIRKSTAMGKSYEVKDENVVEIISPLSGCIRKQQITSLDEWNASIKDLAFGGMPVFWYGEDFWISTNGFREIHISLANRLLNNVVVRPASDFNYKRGQKGRTPGYAAYRSIVGALSGRYRRFGKSCDELMALYRTLDALKRTRKNLLAGDPVKYNVGTESVSEKEPLVQTPEMVTDVKVSLWAYAGEIVNEFFASKGLNPEPAQVDSLRNKVCMRVWNNHEIFVDKSAIENCFDADVKLDAVISLLKK